MKQIKRTERGWAGHFCLSNKCTFHRNTLLESGDIRIVVSTVGAMDIDGKFERTNLNSFYETLVFHAKFDDPYWDSNVTMEISIGDIKTGVNEINHRADMEANDMHENVVNHIIARILTGEFGE